MGEGGDPGSASGRDVGSSSTGALLTYECLAPRQVPHQREGQPESQWNQQPFRSPPPLPPPPPWADWHPPYRLATGRDRGVVFRSLLPVGRWERSTHQGSPSPAPHHAARATPTVPSSPWCPHLHGFKSLGGSLPVCSPISSNLSLKFLYVTLPATIPTVISPILKTHS